MKWEYETVKVAATGFIGGKLDEDTFTTHLNDLGDDEWELVSVFGTKASPFESVSDSVMMTVWLSGPKLRMPVRRP